MKDKVTVCMAVYNGQKYLNEQINSILIQLREYDELIISDDGSKDMTSSILESYAKSDNRIKVIIGPCQGVVKNFENALYCATGDYIFLCDQDDVWNRDKISLCLTFLAEYDLILTNCSVVDRNLNVIHKSFFSVNQLKQGFFGNIHHNSYIGCCMAFNRKVLELSLPFPKNLPMHDWWIGLISNLFGKVKYYDNPLILYRRHESNVSDTGMVSKYRWYKKIYFRFNLLTNLLFRFINRC